MSLTNHDDSHEEIARQDMVSAGLKTFASIIRHWGLTHDQARVLLGNPGRSRYYKQLSHPQSARLSDDELDRLAYITGIYGALNLIYGGISEHKGWLCNPSGLSDPMFYRPWGEGSPKELLLNGKLKSLTEVYEFLEGQRGGV